MLYNVVLVSAVHQRELAGAHVSLPARASLLRAGLPPLGCRRALTASPCEQPFPTSELLPLGAAPPVRPSLPDPAGPTGPSSASGQSPEEHGNAV